jgi:hypothetical protein
MGKFYSQIKNPAQSARIVCSAVLFTVRCVHVGRVSLDQRSYFAAAILRRRHSECADAQAHRSTFRQSDALFVMRNHASRNITVLCPTEQTTCPTTKTIVGKGRLTFAIEGH